jgi:hypothetical protein
MSGAEKVDPPAKSRRPGSMVFRKKSSAPVPTRDEARRQSAVIQSAWTHFREAPPMIAFLNSRHETLQVQPLALALESDDGLRRVERLLQDMVRNS